ncbi:ABC transporter permease subunit [Paraclostridium bifermentans]|uniref:ABC transporter permease subunit n=1 Tax=Paraclostridium bifermentans TaxID=1490 RepID=UPI00359C62C8
MKELVKFELYKIFSKKIVMALIIIGLLVPLISTAVFYIDINKKGFSGYDDIKRLCKNYENQVITPKESEKLENNYQTVMRKYNKGEVVSDYNKACTFIRNDYFTPATFYILNNKMYDLKSMESSLDKLEKDKSTNSYEYKELKYAYDLVSKQKTPRYEFKFWWAMAVDFYIIQMCMAIMIIVGICTIFSNEYQSNTAAIVLSTKYGQKKLTISKIIAGLTFSITIFLIMTALQTLLPAMNGFENWDVTINLMAFYRLTPYVTMNIGTLYISGIVINFIGVILFTLLVMLVSLISKNNMLSFAISVALLLGPKFIGGVMPIEILQKVFTELNIQNLIAPTNLFSKISIYNIFGNPVLYLNVLVTIGIVSIPTVLYFINKLGKKQVLQ